MNATKDTGHPYQSQLDIKDMVNSVSSYTQYTTWKKKEPSIFYWDYNVSFNFDKGQTCKEY